MLTAVRTPNPSGTRAARRTSSTGPSWLIERPRVLDQIAASATPLVALVAPAGYGKSTVARQWARGDGRDASWVALRGADDDPVVLIRSVVAALAPVADLAEVIPLLTGPQPPLERRALPLLGEQLAAADRPLALVIDDVHLLGPQAAGLLDDLLAHLPTSARVLLVGRSLPPALRMARRELAGTLVVLGERDLAFDSAEVAQLAALHGCPPDAEVAASLLTTTRGWAVGLRIAVTGDPTSPPGPLGDHHDARLLGAFIDEEILDRLAGPDRDLVIAASVLEALDPPTCDAVLGPGSGERLGRLARSGAVLVGGTAPGGAPRFHPLFREVLRTRLTARDPERATELTWRAVAAYERAGDHRSAMEEVLGTGDPEGALTVLTRALPTIVFQGEHVSLARWIDAPLFDGIPRDPRLATARAWVALLTGHRGEVQRWLDIARAGLVGRSPGPPADPVVLAADAATMISGLGGARQTLAHARSIGDAGPEGNPWWAVARGIEAVVRYLLDEDDDPEAALRAAEIDTRSVPPSHATVVAHLGLHLLDRGARTEGLEAIDAATDEVDRAGIAGHPVVAMVFAAEARACAERGDRSGYAAAAEHARSLVDGIGGVIDRAYAHLHLILADAALVVGDAEEARRSVHAARSRLVYEPDVAVLTAWADRVVAQIAGGTGDRHLPAISAAEARVLEQLPTNLTFAEIGGRLHLSGNTVKSHAIAMYRKLGVTSRSAAVDAAREVGLLQPEESARP